MKYSIKRGNVDVLLPQPVALEVGEEEAEYDQDGHGDAHQGHQHDVGVV